MRIRICMNQSIRKRVRIIEIRSKDRGRCRRNHGGMCLSIRVSVHISIRRSTSITYYIGKSKNVSVRIRIGMSKRIIEH